MTSLLRNALAARRWAVVAMLASFTVALGVLVMHTTSGSATSHVGPAAVVHSLAENNAAGGAADGGSCQECGLHEHDAVAMTCAVALVVLLTVAAPSRALQWILPPLRTALDPAAPAGDPNGQARRPSLVALGISRT
ncbi:DUF6153 family protein [Myceligenerans indicum]|uniref:DUF2946 domain-containing protein n=1 Tax=Myceligenerans indicum TaxID=2593663 RepID=A0ABS1LJ14_9MICO|nr:DUF6153 family protein [Myceligenerans indicum]MBL0886230.1 hypothetical protein [Myceligenerans indicum]